MLDKNGKDIEVGQLCLIKNFQYKNGKYFYIEDICGQDVISGKRVNKNFAFNRYDKEHNNRKYITMFEGDTIEVIEPLPDAFKKSIRTLHFWIEEQCDEFGVLISKKEHYILRAVKYQNGSYGIIQNKLYSDNSGIDKKFDVSKDFIDMTYEELKVKWDKIKSSRMNIEWIEDFNC